MAKMMYRYVEVMFFLPSEIERQWRGVITHAATPRTAVLEAKRNTFRVHPDAQHVEEYMSRTLTKDKADEIAERMRDGDWTGWGEEEE